MVARAVAATRQLARRQLTWLRAETRALRYDCYATDLRDRVLAGLEVALSGEKKDDRDAV